MRAAIACKLGVVGRSEDTALANKHRIAAPSAEDLDILVVTNNPRRTNEHTRHGRGLSELLRELDRTDGRVNLPAIRISHDINSEKTQAVLRRVDSLSHENDTCTGRKHRHVELHAFAYRAGQVFRLHQTKHRRRFASGYDQACDAPQVVGGSNRPDVSPQLPKHCRVRRPISLERQGEQAILTLPPALRDPLDTVVALFE